jgi:hypothetical protein
MEMIANLFSRLTESDDERQRLLELRKIKTGNLALYTNIDVVSRWYKALMDFNGTDSNLDYEAWLIERSTFSTEVTGRILQVIMETPGSRPPASELRKKIARLSCTEYNKGPEPFEATEVIITYLGSLDRFLSRKIQPISK